MPEPLPIPALEIIAYANCLTDTMLPAVVPPVFREKSAPDRILLPPFTMRDGLLHDATVADFPELQALIDAGEATLLERPLEARHDYELWVGLDREIQYEAIRSASAKLRALAMDRVKCAMDALGAGDLDAAETHCRIALSADDRLMEPIAISAAIARSRSRKGEERLMEKLAEAYLTSAGFEHLVTGFFHLIDQAPIATGDLFVDHPMKGLAAIRPVQRSAAA